MSLIQQTIHYITEPLLYIFNLSFNTDYFLSKMKIAKVIHIFGKGNKLDDSIYRPISLSSQFSKILITIQSVIRNMDSKKKL